MVLTRLVLGVLVLGPVLASAGPDTEAFGPAQSAADIVRTVARSDIAFLPAGLLKSDFKSGELAKMLQFPTDDVSVVELTGKQVRAALERSIALLPSPNPGFLQVSGLQITYNTEAPPNKRIVSVTVSGSALVEGQTYSVAMPGSLARGGLGYFTVWKKAQIKRQVEGQTIETVLKGKSGSDNVPRWKAIS